MRIWCDRQGAIWHASLVLLIVSHMQQCGRPRPDALRRYPPPQQTGQRLTPPFVSVSTAMSMHYVLIWIYSAFHVRVQRNSCRCSPFVDLPTTRFNSAHDSEGVVQQSSCPFAPCPHPFRPRSLVAPALSSPPLSRRPQPQAFPSTLSVSMPKNKVSCMITAQTWSLIC